MQIKTASRHISCYKKEMSATEMSQVKSRSLAYTRWVLKWKNVRNERPLEGGCEPFGVVWRRWAVAMHISCHCTHMSKLYMYIVATSLITFKLKFTHKLLLVQNIVKIYANEI